MITIDTNAHTGELENANFYECLAKNPNASVFWNCFCTIEEIAALGECGLKFKINDGVIV